MISVPFVSMISLPASVPVPFTFPVGAAFPVRASVPRPLFLVRAAFPVLPVPIPPGVSVLPVVPVPVPVSPVTAAVTLVVAQKVSAQVLAHRLPISSLLPRPFIGHYHCGGREVCL